MKFLSGNMVYQKVPSEDYGDPSKPSVVFLWNLDFSSGCLGTSNEQFPPVSVFLISELQRQSHVHVRKIPSS